MSIAKPIYCWSLVFIYTHTYMIDHYNHTVRFIDLVSHTTYIVCINFIHKWRLLQFIVAAERQIFQKPFMVVFLLSEFLPEICWEEIAKKILFVICFDSVAWATNPGFTSNKPTHYLLNCGKFIYICILRILTKVSLKSFLIALICRAFYFIIFCYSSAH